MGYDPVPGSLNANKIQGFPVSPESPSSGQALTWNSSLFEWVPSEVSITGRIGNANLPLGAQLYDNAGTPVIAVDLASRELFNSLGHPTVNFDQGYIYDGTADEIVLFSFGSQSFFDYQGFESADFSNRLIFDHQGGNFPSINFDLRQLIANDGSTVALDWSDPTVISAFGGGLAIARPDGSTDLLSAQIAYDTGAGIVFGFGTNSAWQPINNDEKIASQDGNTFLNNSGFHGVGSVIAGTKTATGTATTTFTVTIGVTMANNTYKVTTEGGNALSSAVHYVNNKTTTAFDIVYLAGLTGAVSIDWIVTP